MKTSLDGEKDGEHDRLYFVRVGGQLSQRHDGDNVIRSFICRYIDAVEVARPRDMSRNHVVSTEYSERFLPTEIYRWARWEIKPDPKIIAAKMALSRGERCENVEGVLYLDKVEVNAHLVRDGDELCKRIFKILAWEFRNSIPKLSDIFFCRLSSLDTRALRSVLV